MANWAKVKPIRDINSWANVAYTFLTADKTATPVTSPVTGGATVTLVVPKSAVRVTLVAVGVNPGSMNVVSGTGGGTFTLPPNIPVTFDVAGFGDEKAAFPTSLSVTAGAASPVSFAFATLTANGL